MKKINIKDISLTFAHNQVPRKALIRVGDCRSKLQTVNDAYLEPGKSFDPHTHADCEEIYYFLEGDGEMNIDNKKFRVTSGDCILVEPEESHGLKNIGKQKLRFITIRISI